MCKCLYMFKNISLQYVYTDCEYVYDSHTIWSNLTNTKKVKI